MRSHFCILAGAGLSSVSVRHADGMPERGVEQYKIEKDQLLLQLTSIDVAVSLRA
jgi:hypothetical protein